MHSLKSEFKKLVQSIVDSLHFKFEQVAIVTVTLGSWYPDTQRHGEPRDPGCEPRVLGSMRTLKSLLRLEGLF